jgi:hypothetical protein
VHLRQRNDKNFTATSENWTWYEGVALLAIMLQPNYQLQGKETLQWCIDP